MLPSWYEEMAKDNRPKAKGKAKGKARAAASTAQTSVEATAKGSTRPVPPVLPVSSSVSDLSGRKVGHGGGHRAAASSAAPAAESRSSLSKKKTATGEKLPQKPADGLRVGVAGFFIPTADEKDDAHEERVPDVVAAVKEQAQNGVQFVLMAGNNARPPSDTGSPVYADKIAALLGAEKILAGIPVFVDDPVYDPKEVYSYPEKLTDPLDETKLPSDIYEKFLNIRLEHKKNPSLTGQEAYRKAIENKRKGVVGLNRGGIRIDGGGGSSWSSAEGGGGSSIAGDLVMDDAAEDGAAGNEDAEVIEVGADDDADEDPDPDKEDPTEDVSAMRCKWQTPFLLQNGTARQAGPRQVFYRGSHVHSSGSFGSKVAKHYMLKLLEALEGGRLVEGVEVPGLQEKINVLVLMCGEMLGMSIEGEPYCLEGEERERFWNVVRRADIIVDLQHNKFPYPEQDEHRIKEGWSKYGAIFLQGNNRGPS